MSNLGLVDGKVSFPLADCPKLAACSIDWVRIAKCFHDCGDKCGCLVDSEFYWFIIRVVHDKITGLSFYTIDSVVDLRSFPQETIGGGEEFAL